MNQIRSMCMAAIAATLFAGAGAGAQDSDSGSLTHDLRLSFNDSHYTALAYLEPDANGAITSGAGASDAPKAGAPAREGSEKTKGGAEPTPPGGWPKGGTTRLQLTNRHLEYALTWYGLAATLIAVFAAYAATRWRRPAP